MLHGKIVSNNLHLSNPSCFAQENKIHLIFIPKLNKYNTKFVNLPNKFNIKSSQSKDYQTKLDIAVKSSIYLVTRAKISNNSPRRLHSKKFGFFKIDVALYIDDIYITI